ncbi:redoxin family protein [Granulicella sp. S156]|jgi:peroxiredoxin|uniref:TlpA family protein disulfide reductase n=1 Tax=Granulicella sp. S156 TaxID=1747224 RepID=UPI00131B20BB|nr:redoxin family protein [Granulicella sp. S156]
MFAKKLDIITLVLLVASIAVNVLLAHQVLKLRADIQNIQSQPSSSLPSIAGTRILAMDALSLDDQPEHISFVDGSQSGKAKVLYIYSPTCGWCARNLGNITKLFDLKHNQFDFIGVSLSGEGLKAYIKSAGFPLQSVYQPSTGAVSALHLDSTPETIVIDQSGVVRKVWVGAYTEDKCHEVEEYFHVTPGSLKKVL